jgi:hypothetical protein
VHNVRFCRSRVNCVSLPFLHRIIYFNIVNHRVGRVLSVSPVVGIGTPPPPLAAGECAPPPFGPGGKGWGSPNSNEGTCTVVLYIYKYFVLLTKA